MQYLRKELKITSSGIVQKYLALSSEGEAHVSRSSSLVSLLNHRSSQLQWSGFPPKLNTREVRGEPLDLAYTGILRNNGSGGIFFSLLDVMSSLLMDGARRKMRDGLRENGTVYHLFIKLIIKPALHFLFWQNVIISQYTWPTCAGWWIRLGEHFLSDYDPYLRYWRWSGVRSCPKAPGQGCCSWGPDPPVWLGSHQRHVEIWSGAGCWQGSSDGGWSGH